MKTTELQKLIYECVMIEYGNDLGGDFGANLTEAQNELDALNSLNLDSVIKAKRPVCIYTRANSHHCTYHNDCDTCDKQPFVM